MEFEIKILMKREQNDMLSDFNFTYLFKFDSTDRDSPSIQPYRAMKTLTSYLTKEMLIPRFGERRGMEAIEMIIFAHSNNKLITKESAVCDDLVEMEDIISKNLGWLIVDLLKSELKTKG